MEPKSSKLGTSLLVPSVQELAKEPLTTIPPRYVRLDQDPPILSNTISLPEAPVIDLSKLSSEAFKDLELENLHHACKEWGFFQLINHGVSSSLVEKVKTGIQDFFNLPMEEKKKFWQQPGEMEGFGQIFVLSEEQKLDWADLFYMITLPTHLRKPHLFPQLPLPFRDNLESYSAELRNLAVKIIDFIAEALKMDNKDMKELFEEGLQAMRMNYYPPCPQPELVIGLNPHSDAVGLTILLQINEMEGLQIKKDGMWLPIKPLPNAFILNIGDILEIVTNGIYRSIEHRATVNMEKERLSIATFYLPKLDGDMGPAPSLITPERQALFKRIGVADYLKGYFSRELLGKSYVDVLRIHNETNEGSST
ncbi:2-oxoglutarate (2OG) and Fe(II)-dependent oxygenase superfamily protein [Quillaja saponaria]|uniref:2-oxoglutarate (2OG) and Fe(II)-dependent oxygenase superfamily protein n=1 Tax=Quillaja saponaria TaxID=32244 RepID=A0AAD7M378_QUISA|nr:2-oxoglutarate (2OG) and Fe(II)-dependent oxygenase superfamily protein [Quillaja saponaria]